MRAFLERFDVPVTLYSHDVRSGPGMPFNWVMNRIVKNADGSKRFESVALGGDAQVIGTILPEAFVRWWAREQDRNNERYLEDILLGRIVVRMTNDVRAVLLDEFRRMAGRDPDKGSKQFSATEKAERTRDRQTETEKPSEPTPHPLWTPPQSLWTPAQP